MILGDGDNISEQIKQWRINVGLTMAEAARQSGVAYTVWHRVESGYTINPTFRVIAAMYAGMGAVLEARVASASMPLNPPQLPLRRLRPHTPDGRIHADA